MAPKRFGSYEILERIAVGGMAEVFRARVRKTGGVSKVVCLKRIHPHLCADQDFVNMFIEEAKLGLALSHGNIVQAFDFGCIDGQYFLVLEHLGGRDLTEVLARARELFVPLPVEVAFFILMEVLEGLTYAHDLKDEEGVLLDLVHRDVSASNVMISTAGEVKILDFGIARFALRDFKTRTGVVKGKLGYMAPEQARGGELDARVDIFACGVLLHELLTGLRPTSDNYPIDGEIVIRCDEERLRKILAEALALDPEERYPSALAMRGALSDYLLERRLSPSSSTVVKYLESIFDSERTEGTAPESGAAFDRFLALAASVPERSSSDPPVGQPLPNRETELISGAEEKPRKKAAEQPDTEILPTPAPAATEEATRESALPDWPDVAGSSELLTEPLPREGDQEPTTEIAESAADEDTQELTPSEDSRGESLSEPVTELLEEERGEGDSTDRPLPSIMPFVAVLAVIVGSVALGWFLLSNRRESSEERPAVVTASQSPIGALDGSPGKAKVEVVEPGEPTPTSASIRDAGVEVEADLVAESDGGVRESRSAKGRQKRAAAEEVHEASAALDRGEVSKTLAPLRPYFHVCLSRSSEPISFVKIRLSIDGQGRATYRGASPSPPDNVSWCFEKVLKRARFRETAAEPLSVVYPIHAPALER